MGIRSSEVGRDQGIGVCVCEWGCVYIPFTDDQLTHNTTTNTKTPPHSVQQVLGLVLTGELLSKEGIQKHRSVSRSVGQLVGR